MDVRDTQAGCKLIRRDVLEAVLPRTVENRFAFDLELLIIARRLGFKRLLEAPITLQHRFSSHVNGKVVLRVFLDTLAIFYRRYVLNAYRPDPEIGQGVEASFQAPGARAVRAAKADSGLRVLILNWRDVRNPEAGGAEVFTHEVASRWAARGHDVTLLTSSFPGAASVELVDEVRIRRCGRLRTGGYYARVQRELWTLQGFDVVVDEINAVPHLTPLWQRRLPPSLALVHQLAGEVWDCELPSLLAAVGRWLEPRLLRLYRDMSVVTISESSRAGLESLGLRNVTVVPVGCDPPPGVAVDKETVPTFLFVGRLAANKRPHHALAAFASIKRAVPTARLWVIGRGPLECELARDLPEDAELLGHLPRMELLERMARAHCLLVPSVREGWGLVVIEANSVGTPAVGYDVAGLRDSIRDGETGLLATAGDPESLAHRAISLVADASVYQAVQRQAVEWAARFSWDVTADQLLELVERVSATRTQATPAAAFPVQLAVAPPGPEA